MIKNKDNLIQNYIKELDELKQKLADSNTCLGKFRNHFLSSLSNFFLLR